MSPACSLLLLSSFLAPAADHESLNPLYKELRETGVNVGAKIVVPLPAPTMADGLDAKAQQAVLKTLAGEDYSVEELTRDSQVAPHVLRIRDVKPSDPMAPARGVDVWCVAYGSLDKVATKEFLEQLGGASQKEGQGKGLTKEDLAKRKIEIKKDDEKYESYGHVKFAFLDKVEISATGRSFWSRTDDSAVVAARLDPAFTNDAEFPNQWRSLTRNADGKLEPGEAHPYEGAAYYVKVTKLAEPKGALFVEGHVVFAEPVKWFDGANLLRSKLPPVIQGQVRSFRRELAKSNP
jgi:hypothetical protein